MIRRSRTILAMGLALAVGVAGFAIADGAADNVSTINGKVKPKKLPKKKFKKAALNSGVTTLDADNSPTVPAEAAEEVYIDYDDDIKIKLGSVPECTTDLAPLDTAEADRRVRELEDQHRPARPRRGSRTSRRRTTRSATSRSRCSTVWATSVLLKAYSPTLGTAGGAAPVVDGTIIKSPRGGDFGKRLSVPNAPDVAGDTGALVAFEATLKKGKVIKARCKDGNKKHNFQASSSTTTALWTTHPISPSARSRSRSVPLTRTV